MKIRQKSLNYHQISSNTHLISSAGELNITQTNGFRIKHFFKFEFYLEYSKHSLYIYIVTFILMSAFNEYQINFLLICWICYITEKTVLLSVCFYLNVLAITGNVYLRQL